MKSIRLFGHHDLRLQEEPEPVPGAGQRLLRVSVVGICGSDLHWYEESGIGDDHLDRPLVIGHEFSAQTEDGLRVAVDPAAPCGGCELCLACHIRIASRNARFGQPEVNLGVIPGYGGTQRLPRIVGFGRATELILTGELIDAEEAWRIGLANKLVDAGEALPSALAMAAVIRSKGQPAVRLALHALRCVPQMGLREGISAEAALFGIACGTEDFIEGTNAFLEKRRPSFSGK